LDFSQKEIERRFSFLIQTIDKERYGYYKKDNPLVRVVNKTMEKSLGPGVKSDINNFCTSYTQLGSQVANIKKRLHAFKDRIASLDNNEKYKDYYIISVIKKRLINLYEELDCIQFKSSTTLEEFLKNFQSNLEKVKMLLDEIVEPTIPDSYWPTRDALRTALREFEVLIQESFEFPLFYSDIVSRTLPLSLITVKALLSSFGVIQTMLGSLYGIKPKDVRNELEGKPKSIDSPSAVLEELQGRRDPKHIDNKPPTVGSILDQLP